MLRIWFGELQVGWVGSAYEIMLTLQHLYSLIDSNQIYTQAMRKTISQFGSKIIIFMLRILSHAPEDVRNSYKGM